MTKTATVRRSYTFKLYPNRAQVVALDRLRSLHSDLYNALIQQRIEAWSRRRKSLGEYEQCAELKDLRAAMPEYAALTYASLQATVQRVDKAFWGFFRRARAGAGARSGFPRFKECDGFGFKGHGSGWRFFGDRVQIKGVAGTIRARGCFPADPIRIRSCDLILRDGSWWIAIQTELMPRMRAVAHHHGEITFDLIDEFARVRRVSGGRAAGPKKTQGADNGQIALSKQRGFDVRPAQPRIHLATSGGRTQHAAEPDRPMPGFPDSADLQRRMARCRRGSHRYRSLQTLKRRRETHAARARHDALHVWTTAVASQYASLMITMPPIHEATATNSGNRTKPGPIAAMRAEINRRILSQSPGMAVAMLQYKMAERGGRIYIFIDRYAPAMAGHAVVTAHRANRELRKAANAQRPS